jgi:hypothetical protein
VADREREASVSVALLLDCVASEPRGLAAVVDLPEAEEPLPEAERSAAVVWSDRDVVDEVSLERERSPAVDAVLVPGALRVLVPARDAPGVPAALCVALELDVSEEFRLLRSKGIAEQFASSSVPDHICVPAVPGVALIVPAVVLCGVCAISMPPAIMSMPVTVVTRTMRCLLPQRCLLAGSDRAHRRKAPQ